MSTSQARSACSWKLKVENWKLFHFPFSIFNFPLRNFVSLVEMMVIPEISAQRLSRQIALRFAEPSCFQTESSFPLWNERPTLSGLSSHGGDDGIRTHDPLLAGQVLSQLSYTPKIYWEFAYLLFLRFRAGRTKWTRTTDLVLIRHAL